jgi:hypothetical protein
MARSKRRGRQGPRVGSFRNDWDRPAPRPWFDDACSMHAGGACSGDVGTWRRSSLRISLCAAHADRLGVTEAGFKED